MKKNYTILFLMMTMSFGLFAQDVNIPDINFKNALISLGVDTNKDGKIQVSEAESKIYLDLSSRNIKDLTGIEAFVNLTDLDCYNNQLTSLDLSKNLKLEGYKALICHNNPNLKVVCISPSQIEQSKIWYANSLGNNEIPVEYSTTCSPITSLSNQLEETATIIKAYNLQGIEVPIDTKDELIILLYDNGRTERVIQY